MNMTTIQQLEWSAHLNGPADATPPVFALLGHWAECLERGDLAPIAWGPDRAAAILGHIAELEASVESLRETIAFNRQQAERTARRHARELAAARATPAP